MTMRGIKRALTERWYSWEDARALAAVDPEIEFHEDSVKYTPKDFVAEEESKPLAEVEVEPAVATEHTTAAPAAPLSPATSEIKLEGIAERKTNV